MYKKFYTFDYTEMYKFRYRVTNTLACGMM